MKNILFAVIITFFATTTVYAASNVIKTSKQWGVVVTSAQVTEVYQLRDIENGVVCYYSYMSESKNVAPVVSCVKVK